MISNLLYKETRLAAHPNLIIFTLMGPLLLIPAYPYTMIFLFSLIGNFVNLMYTRETNDIYYSSLLPLKKSEVVLGKWLVLLVSQMLTILISIPFAFLRLQLVSQPNPVGIEANVAFYGFGLMIFACFNFIFLTSYFKTVYKVGTSFLKGLFPATFLAIIVECLVHFPGLTWLDSVTLKGQMQQLPILGIGILIYAVAMWATYKISVRRFSQVNL
ncbi:ABC-2 transporter permease [Enterococcus sp. DIV0756]|uniref:ABC-2 transporter permease n=1 Tax=Enterococcus sp. DIV0756 TaxID=2774636 RepID=UPI003F237201